ncbi:MAG: methyltransferase domain-containing protein [Propioniciclava sp.]|uniref:class I SAM-dependent methyltransferase n=1 Tax=Propioniciclava sp. TaxID=2038686 RepID=UPI0039E6FC53
MSASSQPAFPQTALQWLLTPPDGAIPAAPRLLAFGRSAAPLVGALDESVRVVACDTSRAGVRTLLNRFRRALPVVAQAAHLPFAPKSFDVVAVHQSLHALPEDSLASIARVLTPTGHLAVSYIVRDDSVPWVRRLGALLRDVDPEAMAGAYGTESVERLSHSPFFTDVVERRHRLWVPISRVNLLDMVARRFPDLESDRLGQLMASVGNLYESSARVPEPLLLPYQVSSWKAVVNHAAVSSTLADADPGLPIRL